MAMKIASLRFQFIFPFPFLFFPLLSVGSHVSPITLHHRCVLCMYHVVCAFDVCRSTNCMRDILASTSTQNSVIGERMTTAHFLSLSSTTHFRSSNIEICLYLLLLLFCGRKGTFNICGCRRWLPIISERNRCNDHASCLNIHIRWTGIVGKRTASISFSRSGHTIEFVLAGIRAPFSLICKTAFDSKCAHYTRACVYVCMGISFHSKWRWKSAACTFPLAGLGARGRKQGRSGWVTRVTCYFSHSRIDHINSTSAHSRSYTL